LVRSKFVVFRAVVSAYVLIAHPPVSVPDPTERLIAMMKDLSNQRARDFWWDCNTAMRRWKPRSLH
jgi:hypothetical protein